MRRRRSHVCVVEDGLECVAGSLYDGERRKARPVCRCKCHGSGV